MSANLFRSLAKTAVHFRVGTSSISTNPFALTVRNFARVPKRSSRAGAGAVESSVDPWVAVKDPEGSGRIYWWNKRTDETTPLDAPKPGSEISVPPPGSAGVANANPMIQQAQSPGLMG
jgi:hypothetical protein